ncbi:hypothetical protein N9140_00815 [bacterium]|nr:hypothetical protein [bacterium]
MGPSLYLLQECAWEVTFESKAGDVASLEVARSGTSDFTIDEELTDAELNSGNRIVVTDGTVRGTAEPVVNFRLEYDGELTGYMPHDASSELVKSSLDALSNIGEVSVTMIGPDSRCHIWEVTFISDLGPLPLLVADDLDLTGTGINVYDQKQLLAFYLHLMGLIMDQLSFQTHPIYPPYTRIEAGMHSILQYASVLQMQWDLSIHHTLPTF